MMTFSANTFGGFSRWKLLNISIHTYIRVLNNIQLLYTFNNKYILTLISSYKCVEIVKIWVEKVKPLNTIKCVESKLNLTVGLIGIWRAPSKTTMEWNGDLDIESWVLGQEVLHFSTIYLSGKWHFQFHIKW